MNARSSHAKHTNTTGPLSWATLALDYGVQALSEAERDGATAGEIVRLCDEVIARRLQVQTMRLEADWSPPTHVLAQIERDRQLLDQPSVLDE